MAAGCRSPPSATRRTASAVDRAATSSTSGRLAVSQARHCPVACGNDTMRRMSNSVVSGVRQQVLGHRQDDLADDDQVPLEHQLVEGDRHGALDGVLQGHEAVVDGPVGHRGQHVHERRQRPQLGLGQARPRCAGPPR